MTDEFDGTPTLDGETPTPEPTSPAPLGTPAPTGATPTAAETYELTWRGKKIPVEGRDKVIEFAQKGYDYTQKMQEVAEQRRQVENWIREKAEYDQAIAEARQFLQNPQAVRQYLAELERQTGGMAPPAPGAPPAGDEVLTREQAMKLLEQERAQIGQFTQKQLADMRAQFEVDQLASQYSRDLDSHIGTLKGQYRELASIPRVKRLLKEAVQEMGPQNIEEAKQYMAEVAQQFATQVRESLMEARKQAATVPAPLAKGIEPPGGAGPMPPPPTPFKGKITSDDFKRLVTEEIQRSMSQK